MERSELHVEITPRTQASGELRQSARATRLDYHKMAEGGGIAPVKEDHINMPSQDELLDYEDDVVNTEGDPSVAVIDHSTGIDPLP